MRLPDICVSVMATARQQKEICRITIHLLPANGKIRPPPPPPDEHSFACVPPDDDEVEAAGVGDEGPTGEYLHTGNR